MKGFTLHKVRWMTCEVDMARLIPDRLTRSLIVSLGDEGTTIGQMHCCDSLWVWSAAGSLCWVRSDIAGQAPPLSVNFGMVADTF